MHWHTFAVRLRSDGALAAQPLPETAFGTNEYGTLTQRGRLMNARKGMFLIVLAVC